MDAATLVALLRLAFTAAVVVGACLAIERVGPFLGAMIATLPLSAGPAWVFLAIDHGDAFVAKGAVTSLVSIGANAVFVGTYVPLAERGRGMAMSLGAAVAACLATMGIAGRHDWTLAEALPFTLALQLGAGILTVRARARLAVPLAPSRAWHLALRTAGVIGLVALVMSIGRMLGPGAAGFAAFLPVVFSSIVVIVQPVAGGPAAAKVIAHSLVGMLGYGPALTLLHLAAEPLGATTALLLAFATCLGWNAALVVHRRAA